MGFMRETSVRTRLPRLSSLHISVVIGIFILIIVSSSYHDDVQTYLGKVPAAGEYSAPIQNIHDHVDPEEELELWDSQPTVPSSSGKDASDHGILGHVTPKPASPGHAGSDQQGWEQGSAEYASTGSLAPGHSATDPGTSHPVHLAPAPVDAHQAAATSPRIPNIVHFTQISASPDAPFTFDFRQCLSIYSAWLRMHPDIIFIHTNATDAQINAARRGEVTKWAKIVLGLPNVKVNQVEMLTHAGNGVAIEWLAHTSDFLRIEMVSDVL